MRTESRFCLLLVVGLYTFELVHDNLTLLVS
jgi:hypothetical protein